MGVKKPDAPDFYWFQKLRELRDEASEWSEQYLFWQALIGGSDYQELVDVNQFCSFGLPEEIPWTQENLIAYGSAEVLKVYAQRVMYQKLCDEVV